MSISNQYIFILRTSSSNYQKSIENNRIKVNKLNIYYKNKNKLNKLFI